MFPTGRGFEDGYEELTWNTTEKDVMDKYHIKERKADRHLCMDETMLEDKPSIDHLVARQFHFYEGKLYKVTETYRGLSEYERDDIYNSLGRTYKSAGEGVEPGICTKRVEWTFRDSKTVFSYPEPEASSKGNVWLVNVAYLCPRVERFMPKSDKE